MDSRVALVVILSAVAAAVVVALAFAHPQTTVEAATINLCTEVIGIGVTVALLDRLAERRAKGEEVRSIAWRVLHEIDHAIWVWQGGARAFDLDELRNLLACVQADDPLPDFTQNLLLRIGSASEATIRERKDLMKLSGDLKAGLQSASTLASLRDSDDEPSPTILARDLRAALPPLISIVSPEELIEAGTVENFVLRRDPSVLAQERRHFGSYLSSAGAGEVGNEDEE